MSTSGIRAPRRRGFPAGPRALESAKLLAAFFEDPVAWYADLRETWGDLVGLRAGPLRMIVCFDADLLQRILVDEPRAYRKGAGLRAASYILGDGLITADGASYRRHRKLAAPVFAPRNIEPFADMTVALAHEMLDEWPQDGVVAVARDCFDVSLRIAGVGLFGTDFDQAERDRLHKAMQALDEGYQLFVTPGGPALHRLKLLPISRRVAAGRTTVDELFRSVVARRRLDGDAPQMTDLLSRLLAARDEDDGSSFSDEELRDEAVTMLLAGHDTTAASLTWALALLALHPEQQAWLRAEVDEVLAGRRATAADLRALPRLRAAIDETLRLHPVVYSTVREPIEPVELDGGIVLPPGTDVVVPISGLHRDSRHWSDPLAFRPERFLDDAAAAVRHKLAYLPFGTGPRVCIGSSFALQELTLVVATVLQRFELAAPVGFQLQPHVGFIRRPAGPVPLRVTRRPIVQVDAG